MRLSLLLAFILTSTIALAADRQINQISVEQSDSDTIIRLFGSELIRSPKDRVFFAAEASSYSVEPTMMYGDSEYVEVALGMPVMAGQYRISIGPNENTSTLESMVVIGAIGPQGPAGQDGADGRDGVDGLDGAPGADGKDGTNGINGVNGTNGLDGADGENGADGSSCSASQDGSSVLIMCTDGTSGVLVGADDLSQSLNFLLDTSEALLVKIEALEERVLALEPYKEPIFLDQDGLIATYAGSKNVYQYVTTPTGFDQALTIAGSSTYNGIVGHLVTISSDRENQFIHDAFVGPQYQRSTSADEREQALAWIAIADSEIEGVWKWVAGPEAGEVTTYSNWVGAEPNDCCGGEDEAVIHWSPQGGWYDVDSHTQVSRFGGHSFVIEYENAF